MANASRVQPPRACKKARNIQQLPAPVVAKGNVTAKVIVEESCEPEKSKHENTDTEQNNVRNPLDAELLRVRYTDKPN